MLNEVKVKLQHNSQKIHIYLQEYETVFLHVCYTLLMLEL